MNRSEAQTDNLVSQDLADKLRVAVLGKDSQTRDRAFLWSVLICGLAFFVANFEAVFNAGGCCTAAGLTLAS